jgi:ArsR family transcriptional regulator
MQSHLLLITGRPYTCMMTQVTKHSAPPATPDSPRKAMTPLQAFARKRPVDAMLNPELFRALSDDTRIKLLGCLIKCARACSVSEIAACCNVDLSVVSRHLQQLERAGILNAQKKGRVVSYSVRYTDLCNTLTKLAAAIEACKPPCKDGCSTTSCCGGCCD